MKFISFAAFLVAVTIAKGVSASDCPEYPEDMKGLIVADFKREILVRDAAILQDECDLRLVLIVNAATSEDYAKDLGERFVRMTKGLGPGPGPSKQIGKGIYSYLVGVYTSSEDQLALGAKAAGARRIMW